MSARRTVLGSFIALSVLFAGCGGSIRSAAKADKSTETTASGTKTPDGKKAPGTTGATSTGKVDMCKVISEEDAEAVFDGKINLERDDSSTGATCTYSASKEDAMSMAIVVLQYLPDAMKDSSFETVAKMTAKFLGDDAPVAVKGIGDGAYRAEGLVSTLLFAKDTSMFSISIMGLDDPTAALADLANKALERT